MSKSISKTDSRTLRFLGGKKMAGLPAPISRIEKQGLMRKITDARGNTLVVTKERLKTAFNQVLVEHQRKEALKSVRPTITGQATVKLGGLKKGKDYNYKTMQAARQAAFKRYTNVK